VRIEEGRRKEECEGLGEEGWGEGRGIVFTSPRFFGSNVVK